MSSCLRVRLNSSQAGYFTRSPIHTLRGVWESDLTRREAVDYRLLELGIYNSPLHRFHLSLAHHESDLAKTIDAIDRAVSQS